MARILMQGVWWMLTVIGWFAVLMKGGSRSGRIRMQAVRQSSHDRRAELVSRLRRGGREDSW